MPYVNFNMMSNEEFENLSRDLLQKKFDVTFESFGKGPDQGMDFRYINPEGDIWIVQCKKYEKWEQLFRKLIKENQKVKKLNPNRYFLCVSVSLTPKRKKKIIDLFSPFIKKETDILGKEDLVNLLYNHPEIKKNYRDLFDYEMIVNVRNIEIINRTEQFIDEIYETSKYYTKTEMFYKAFSVLKENGIVIISGPPGTGKTTLSKMIIKSILENTDYYFAKINTELDDPYRIYIEKQKQIFFMDDFLGRNFLNQNSLIKQENLLKFIYRIKNNRKQKNKYLIITTREYILEQFKSKSNELYNEFKKLADIYNCVLDIGTYSNLEKAKILYNHLLYSAIPTSHIKELCKDKCYMRIIKNENYNPRVIETMTRNLNPTSIAPESYYSKFLETLNNPSSIWLDAFKGLSAMSKIILYVMTVYRNGYRINFSRLRKLSENFFEKVYGSYPNDFERALKENITWFLETEKTEDNQIIVKFKNPSMKDFMIDKIKNDRDIQREIITNIGDITSLLSIFYTKNNSKKSEGVLLTVPLNKHLYEKIISFLKSKELPLKKLYNIFLIARRISLKENKTIKNLVVQEINKVDLSRLNDYEISWYIEALSEVRDSVKFEERVLSLAKNILERNDYFLDYLESFSYFNIYCPKEFGEILSNNEWIIDKIKDFIIDETNYSYSNIDEDLIDSIVNPLFTINDNLNLGLDDRISIFEMELNDQVKKDFEQRPDFDIHKIPQASTKRINDLLESRKIDEMFENLPSQKS